MASDLSLVIGLVAIAVVLILVIVIGVLVVCWLLWKLRQHENDILELQDVERQFSHSRSEKDRNAPTDRYVSPNDIGMQETNGGRRPLSQTSEISHRSMGGARMTIMIKKEEANMYGLTPPLGQVLMTAQNFYKAQTNTINDIPIERVQVMDKVTLRKSRVSKVIDEDWREGVPTSLLFNGAASSFDDVFSQNKGIFVHKKIGPRGGSLNVSGVSIDIPPHALKEETMISIGIIWDSKFTPSLTERQCMLSPVVLCQPSGLKFNSPVTLTFPHAALNVKTDWVPKILKREGDLSIESDWVSITLADYEEREVTDAHVRLKLNHFTLYTCTGESKLNISAAKLVHIVAFTGKLQRGSHFKPRVYCINKYKDELEEVETLVGKMDPTNKLTETTELMIRDNQQDVMVEIAKLSDDWNLAGDRTEVLPFSQVWHDCHPHCTFVMKPKKSSLSEIYCEIHAFQNGDENNSSKLKISETMSQPSSPLSSIEDDPQEDLTNELVILLDPKVDLGTDTGDWRNLAEKMNIGLARIRWLGTQSSPTRVLIEKWFEDGKTFRELQDVMEDIHRADAAEEIRKRMPEIEKSTVI